MVQGRNTKFATNARLRPQWLLGLLTLLVAAPVYSQSLGDIAREELKRKQDQPRRTTHVYDNDDLARPQILLPEDQERIRASKKKDTPPAGETAKEEDGGAQKPNALPRSDVAQYNHAPETHPQHSKPLSFSLPPMLVSPSLAYPAPWRPPVRHAVPPVSLGVAGTRAEHAGKAIHRAEIASSENVVAQRRVRVQQGDSLWKLAFKYLGQGKDWLVLVGRNPQVTDPQRLEVGMWLRLPDEAPDPKPPERVRIKPGDSLWKLTQARFGDGRAWSCVAQANPQLHNANLVFPGQILEIPDRCAARSLARVRFPKIPSGPPPSSTAELQRQTH